jgi:glyoxylase-like metal-dependent hydrolase (beta-lactamase superfamily II)
MGPGRFPLLASAVVSAVAALPAYGVETTSPWVERLSERVVLVRSGERYYDQAAAVATERGLVVIDTSIAPSLAQGYRRQIEQAFGRSDFTYLINTHYHYDHTNGNQVFSEVPIIGHELCLAGMRRFASRLDSFLTTQKARIPGWERRLASLDPDSEQAVGLRDTMSHWRHMARDLETPGVFVPTLPSITFADRLTLDLGDVTLRLVYFGKGGHTGDDLLVHVPEEKLLFTGDLFWSGSVLLAYQSQIDPQRWLEALDWVLAEPDAVERVVTTHNGLMGGEQIRLRRDYLADALEGLRRARKEGLGFAAAAELLHLDRGFDYLERSGLDKEQLVREHREGLRMLWRHLAGTRSAAEVLEEVLADAGLVGGRELLRRIESAPPEAYYVDEGELNSLGYRLLGQKRIEEALLVFEANVSAFPESANVHDSLGEAHLAAANTDQAILSYRRALELDPDNDNARQALERLEAAVQKP